MSLSQINEEVPTREELRNTIFALIQNLPDTNQYPMTGKVEECWEKAWNKLSDSAQKSVKRVREIGDDMIARLDAPLSVPKNERCGLCEGDDLSCPACGGSGRHGM